MPQPFAGFVLNRSWAREAELTSPEALLRHVEDAGAARDGVEALILDDGHPQREYRPWDRSGTGYDPSARPAYEERDGRMMRSEAHGPRETRGGPEPR